MHMFEGEEKADRIDELDKRLYSRSENALPPRRHGILHQLPHKVDSTWKNTDQMKAKVKNTALSISVFKKFFIFSIIFFVLAVGFGIFKFYGGGNTVSTDNIAINVLGNAFASGGEELPLQVEIINQNSVPLQYADLMIDYPKGGADATPGNMAHDRIPVDNIDPGKSVEERISPTLFGEQGSTQTITLTLQFSVPGSNAIFQKVKEYPVNISSAPVSMTVDAPSTISPNQELNININITSNSQKTLSGLMLKVDYPTGFQFESSVPASSYLSDVWNLPDLVPGTPQTVSIKGTVLGSDGEERSFRIYAGNADSTDKNNIGIVFNSSLYTLTIEKPFIQASLAINGNSTDDTVLANPRSSIRTDINWANNLPTQVLNGEITLQLAGDLIDKSSVNVDQGFYDSKDNTIVWNKDTDPAFASLAPGASGTVGFTLSSLSLLKPDHTLYADPQISLDVSIKGMQPAQGDIEQEVDSSEHKTIKFNTDFQVSADGSYSTGPFTNAGPFPPAADKPTTYTIIWTATSSANDVDNVVARASLPTYVHFLGNVSPSTEDVSIDPTTGEVVWKAGTIAKGSGFTGNARQVYFQVELDPSVSQVDSVPTLILDTKATGTDSYTNAPLSSSWNPVTTNIFNDPAFHQGMDKVTQ